jgi:hypothetical protein
MDAHCIDWGVQDWKDLRQRLLSYATRRLARVAWRDGGLVRRADAEDLVGTAIAKTIEGTRVWHSENCTLFRHLQGVIDSDTSHAAHSRETRLDLNDGDALLDRSDGAADPEQIAVGKAEQQRLFDYLSSKHPTLGRMAVLMCLHDLRGTSELCRELDVDPQELANLRKRMKRLVRAYLEEDRP